MRKFLIAKMLIVLIALAFLSLGSASTAFASSSTGTQNPHLTVIASATSNGINPEQAAVGNQVTITLSVRNNTTTNLQVQENVSLTAPNGVTQNLFSNSAVLPARQTASDVITYTVDASIAKGSYTVTYAVSDRRGTSSASATITII